MKRKVTQNGSRQAFYLQLDIVKTEWGGDGGSIIVSAGYSIDGSDTQTMYATDEDFDESSEAEATISFTEPGVYNICVSGTDVADNTGQAECFYLAVYDPDGGFVTGGGWIISPEEAYADDSLLTGKANFGFVSKYKKGATVPSSFLLDLQKSLNLGLSF